MKSFKLILAAAFFSIVGLMINSCGPSRPAILKQNPAYAEYVSGYTSGMISRKGTIRIELADVVGGDTRNWIKKVQSFVNTTDNNPIIVGNNHIGLESQILS